MDTEKKEAIADFIRSLEISIKQASIYFKKHPAFLKSVEELKTKSDALLSVTSPLRIFFTPHSLFIEEEHWDKDRIHKEMAKTFHHRMVKSLEMREGLTTEELATFIIKANLPSKDILKRGGLKAILEREEISHLSVEALDYSQILKGEGEEIQDVWEYYLKEALMTEDSQKINKITENFEKVIPTYKAKELLENEELFENINKLFQYHKKVKKESFQKCAKFLLKSLMKNKDISQESKLDNVQTLFKDLSDEDFARTLWEELSTDRTFDSLSFNIFARLTEKNREKQVARSLSGLIKKKDIFEVTPDLIEKIRDLLASKTETFVPEIYRNTLLSLFKDIKFKEKLAIDRNLLQHNYFYLLFEFLNKENNKEKIIPLLEQTSKEWEKRDNRRDLEYSKILFPLLASKHQQTGSESSSKKLRKQLSPILERAILRGDISQDFDDQLEFLEETSLNANTYLNKIFREYNAHPYILQLFFKFFPDEMNTFIGYLKKRKTDVQFLEKVIESLKAIDSHLTLTILALESIFSYGNTHLKLKVLNTMQALPKYDEDFLITVLKKEDLSLKKEALTILAKDKSSKEKAFEVLLSISSPFGTKNRILQENLSLIEELGLKEARKFLIPLGQSRAFWHKTIKSESLRILGRWNERKD